MRDRAPQRLLLFLPPRLNAGGRMQFASGTVVPYIALGGRESTRGEAPVALLPKAGAVDLVFDSSDVFITAIESPKLRRSAAHGVAQHSRGSLARGRRRLPLRVQHSARRYRNDDDCGATENAGRGDRPRHPDPRSRRGHRGRLQGAAAYSEIYTVPAPAAGVLSVRVDRDRGIARSATHGLRSS